MAWLGLGLGLTFRVRVSTVSRVRARVGAKVFTKSDAASYAAGSVGSIFFPLQCIYNYNVGQCVAQ